MHGKAWDMIVVGAGAAGAVVADRLSEDPRRTVLLVEAGSEARSPLYRIPLGIGRLRAARGGLWRDETEPEPHLDGRRLPIATGRVMGGSAAINGMIHMRPPDADFERWAAHGGDSWGAAAMAAAFEAIVGSGGLAPRPGQADHPLDQAFLAACSAAGLPRRDNPGRSPMPGAGPVCFDIQDGRRHSTPQTYLTRARMRPNLTVLSKARVLSIGIEGGRARMVHVVRGRQIVTLRCAGEIVLTAGALRSPQILALSGLGAGDELRRLGITPVVDLPGVGANLQNHVDIALRFACPAPVTLHSLLRAERIIPEMARAWLTGGGPAARFPGEVAAVLDSQGGEGLPDLLCHLVHGLGIRGIRWPFARAQRGPLDQEGFSCRVMLLRPDSRGRVALRTADPRDPPSIRFDYLSHASEMRRMIAGVRRMREIFADRAFDGLRAAEIEPGPAARDDAAIAAWIRARADMQCHPTGTCAIGDGDGAVVDPRLRVRGVAGLRVADASVMPEIVGANTFATTVAIAERAAHFLRADGA